MEKSTNIGLIVSLTSFATLCAFISYNKQLQTVLVFVDCNVTNLPPPGKKIKYLPPPHLEGEGGKGDILWHVQNNLILALMLPAV